MKPALGETGLDLTSKIILVTGGGSGIAFVASPGTPVYSETKALIHHCAQTLRHQLKPHGITVFEALPPVVDTEMASVLKSDNFKKMKPADLVRDILEGLRRNQTEMLLG